MASKDIASLYSPRERGIQQEYQEWSKAHQRIKNGPPQEGRDYVKHAKNLLPILEVFAELHPVAKAVVTGFKAVVMYEEDRKENDARVAVLFLYQSDIMGTLLDVNQLSMRRKSRSEDNEKGLYSDSILSAEFHSIALEIKACGNSMDTYYKEVRFVKFWKSQEWKKRITDHATKFDAFRLKLQQVLSIQIASDVGTVSEKMDVLLLRLFAPKAEWEKKLVEKTRQLGKPKDTKNSQDLINNTSTLQTLVSIADDASLNSRNTEHDAASAAMKSGYKAAIPTEIEQLRKELQLPLDILCDRNEEMFELKLNYHTQQLQEAILNSANYVVQSLSGPYDRLHDEDLKILWKEMNWIFCVDNKLFTSALFEYYLDHFSTSRQKLKTEVTGQENGANVPPSSENEAEMAQEYLTKVTFLSRLGVINHVDAWTLELMAKYGHRISSAIDRDESGFIRISEANAFTERIPKGWNLPQWCAYAALGESYEARIYRKRIHNILAYMMELQAKVLPLNRSFVALSTVPDIIPFFQLMAWEPAATDLDSEFPSELRLLVLEKIEQQDTAWRQKLSSFKWMVEDETTIQLLYDKIPLETYILQLSVLLLEYAYDVMQACCFVIIDIKEMSRILTSLRVVQRLCMSHVGSLRMEFLKEKKSHNYLETFSGGIWRAVEYSCFKHDDDDDDDYGSCQDKLEKVNNSLTLVPFRLSDVQDFLTDEAVLQEFPIHSLAPGDIHNLLKYRTWEEYAVSLPQDKIPQTIPDSWESEVADGAHDNHEDYGFRHDWSGFPLTFRACSRCRKTPIQEYYYVCTICADFDLCSACAQLPSYEHAVEGHEFSHPVLRFALHTVHIQRNWLMLEAQAALYEIQQDIEGLWYFLAVRENPDASQEHDGNGDTTQIEVGSPFHCNECGENIPLDGANIFYKCMRRSCGDYLLCERCDQKRITSESPEDHQWWHTMLVLRRDIVIAEQNIRLDAVPPDDSKGNISPKSQLQDDGLMPIISAINERISGLEKKIDAANSMLQNALASPNQDKVRITKNDDNRGPKDDAGPLKSRAQITGSNSDNEDQEIAGPPGSQAQTNGNNDNKEPEYDERVSENNGGYSESQAQMTGSNNEENAGPPENQAQTNGNNDNQEPEYDEKVSENNGGYSDSQAQMTGSNNDNAYEENAGPSGSEASEDNGDGQQNWERDNMYSPDLRPYDSDY